MSSYTVQRQDADSTDGWQDIATVEVSARVKRRTILQQVLKDDPQPGTYRVLDAESAREMPVELEEQPPRLKIG